MHPIPHARQRALLLLLVAFAAFLAVGVARAGAQQPNIVLIKTDDEGPVGTLLSSRMPTRHAFFDRGGVTFTDYRSSTPLCCPDRASTLTGLWEHHHGVIDNGPTLNPAMTIATQLHGVGYTTIEAGKYLNGCHQQCRTVLPGWDHWFVPDQLVKYGPGKLSFYTSDKGPGSKAPLRTLNGYQTDLIFDHAAQAIRDAPASRPFFAYITPSAPHVPTTPSPQYAHSAKCAGVRWTSPAYLEQDVSDKPAWVRDQPLPKGFPDGFPLAKTCRTLLSVDDGLRSILAAVGPDRMDNTLFIYVGDNGMNYGEHHLGGKQAPYATLVPLQMHAAWLPAGGTVSESLQNVDIAPTLCALAGCTLGPYPTGQLHPDGASFLGLLLGTDTSMGRDALLEENLSENQRSSGSPPWRAVRTTGLSPVGRWHYIRYLGGGGCELYDSAADPYELENLMQPDTCTLRPSAAADATVVLALDARLDALIST